MKFVIGIDIGGTSIKGASVNLDGEIMASFSFGCVKGEDGCSVAKKLANNINSFIEENNYSKDDILGVGIGCAGAINAIAGTVDYSNNLDWYNVPLCKIITDITGLESRITNDAKAATLGEYTFGAGKKYKNIVLLTLGTGVGGGVILDGKLLEGNDGKGYQLGHMTLKQNGRLCTCGRRGCTEMYASATGLVMTTKEFMEKNPDSVMWKLVNGNINRVTGRTCWDADIFHDETARQVIETYISELGDTIISYGNVFRPDAILLSGGIAKQGENLSSRLVTYCEKYFYGFKNTPKFDIKIAELGYNTGIIGAASLFIKD